MKSILAIALQLVTLSGLAEERHRAVWPRRPIGSVVEYTVPSVKSVNGVTAGPNGKIWFTATSERDTPQLGSIDEDGAVTIALSGSGRFDAIAAAPDGSIWFAISYGQIGRLVPGNPLQVFNVRNDAGITSLTFSSDGALWFIEGAKDRIGRLTLTGELTEVALPPSLSTEGQITAASDGTIWFTAFRRVVRLTPDGAITSFDPFAALHAFPTQVSGIAPGPDGDSVWVTAAGDGGIGVGDVDDAFIARVSLQGEVSRVLVRRYPLFPRILLRGSDAYYTAECVCAHAQLPRTVIARIVNGAVTNEYDMPVQVIGIHKVVGSMAQSADGDIWAAYDQPFPIIARLILH